jgi:malate dehydrogenase (quinone)
VGTDVNYGEITRQLIAGLQKHDNFSLQLGTVVRRFKRNADKSWTVTLADADNRRQKRVIKAKFIFIGAGGGADPAAGNRHSAGQRVCGLPGRRQFLVCENPEVVNHHLAKVYGQAEVGAPPMSVPHIDTRIIDGKRVVLFGPFATFSTRFLKNGSLWDLLASTNTSNILPMLNVGLDNFDLVKYLISQVMQKDKDRLAALCEYYPEARKETGGCGRPVSACRSSSAMRRRAGYCAWAPKWSAMTKAPSRRCSARRQAPPPRRLSCCS